MRSFCIAIASVLPGYSDMQKLHLAVPVSTSIFFLQARSMNILLCSLQDLISHLLVVDVKKRYDTDDILEHPWIKVCSFRLTLV